MRFAQFEDHHGKKDERVMLLTGEEMQIVDKALNAYVANNKRLTKAAALLRKWDKEAPLHDF